MRKIKILSVFRGYDWPLFISSLLLTLLGLSVIYSLSLTDTGLKLFDKQIIALSLGLIALIIFSSIDYRKVGSFSWIWYVLSLAILGGVLLFGENIRGTTGWFIFGQFSFQPVELVKIIIIIVLAYYLSGSSAVNWQIWLKSFLIILPIIILLLLQPDFGPIFIILIIWLAFNAFRGLSKKGWLILMFVILAVSLIAWFGILNDNQKGRLKTFINPSLDPGGQGFQVRQSIIAVGSGGLLGSGLGQGGQSQLKFLPEAPTDFVFASLLEQLGLVGFIILLIIWLVFFWRTMRISQRALDNFTLYLSLGLTLLIFIQTAVNVAMNLGLAPIVGLPLPFLSYGGSALVATLLAVGLLESIAIRQKIK